MNENQTENEKVSPKQRLAIEALLLTGSVSEAAAAAGVTRSTLYRWQNESVFQSAMAEIEQGAIRTLASALTFLSERSIAALHAALDPGQKITTRIRAVEVVLGNIGKLNATRPADADPDDTELDWWNAALDYKQEDQVQHALEFYNTLTQDQKDQFWMRDKAQERKQ